MTILASFRANSFAASLGLALLPVFSAAVSAQTTNYYNPNGTEYSIVGALPGDQVFPDAAISSTGGYVVWQDNVTDGDGWGISARRLDSTLSGTLSTFRVNQLGAGDQEFPRMALLRGGGAAFVWQGGLAGNQHIYAEFLSPSNTFVTPYDIEVNSFPTNFQVKPAIATLVNSNVVVVWGSYDQAGTNSLQDVYGQILTPGGVKVGGEFLINQFTAYNQRTPAVAATTNGGFVVAWVSEQERIIPPNFGTNNPNNGVYISASSVVNPSVDIYARQFSSTGAPVGNEFLVNTDNSICANPSVAAATDGTFTIAWGENNPFTPANGWDIYARSFSNNAVGGPSVRVNTHVYGDQYTPRISSLGIDYLVTWTSLGQDGSREGVYGQYLRTGGALIGTEFLVNTTTSGSQMQPTIASDGVEQFLVVWTSNVGAGSPNGFDLYAQRYANANAVLQPMSAPYVYAPFVLSNNIYQPRLVVSWAPLLGLSVSNYQVFVDGTNAPTVSVTTNQWTMTAAYGLTPGSTHTFQLDYVTTDGRSPASLSPATTATAWGGQSWGGIPYEWMAAFFGGYTNGQYHTTFWPAAGTLVGPNLTLLQVFVSGGNPWDSSTWLQQQLVRTAEGMFLTWNTQPGSTYQVQSTTDFGSWSNVGSPRFASGTTDSIYVGGGQGSYYRVAILR